MLVLLFGAPGLLLLMSGSLPGRGVVGRTKMIFVPTRLVVGLSMTAAGVAVLFLYYQVVHVAPKVVLIGAMLAVPCGLLFAASCWTEACRNCSVPLKEFRARFNAGSRAMLEAAVRNGAVKEILALRAAPPTAGRVDLLIRYCQRCRMVGLLEGPGKDAIDEAYLEKYDTRGSIQYARDLGRAKSRATTTELIPL